MEQAKASTEVTVELLERKILAPKWRISNRLMKAFAECVSCMNITVGSPIDIESDSESSVKSNCVRLIKPPNLW
jgi:hypothetical protein